MKCPRCTTVTLLMSSRDGVEIDYCPQCRGVWLDRGELDKIIERSETAYRNHERGDHTGRSEDTRRRYGDDNDDDERRGFNRKRKRKGFLSEMFEFGD